MSKCKWTPDDDCGYIAECDNGNLERAFCFTDDGPLENKFEFCPYCGRKIDAEPA